MYVQVALSSLLSVANEATQKSPRNQVTFPSRRSTGKGQREEGRQGIGPNERGGGGGLLPWTPTVTPTLV